MKKIILQKVTVRCGFSLMELMIVIVIIGILAAGSLVIFGDKGEKAKIAVTKANHKSVVKFITYELIQCNMGATTVMSGNLTCSGRTRQSVIDATVKALSDIKNPYGEMDQNLPAATRMNAVTDGGTYSSGGSGGGLGYVRLQNQSAKVLRIGTCYQAVDIGNNDYTCQVSKTNYTYLENDVQILE